MNKIILCVEDNEQIQLFNKIHLESKGFTVRLAMTLAEAREEIGRETPGLIILDIHLPDGNGLDFLRELRKTSNIPVIALTDSKEDVDIVKGLESGCDDYVPKPYTFPVLCARIEGLMRRVSSVPETISFGSFKLDLIAMQAFFKGRDLMLSHKEFALFSYFVQNEGKAINAEYIYEKVWKQLMVKDDGALKNIVYKLRKKLSASGYTITNERGSGYIFEPV